MMRLSAGLIGLHNVSTGYFDCSSTPAHRTLCASLDLPSAPHAPQVRAWRRGVKYAGDSGELLYNPNHIEPHYALQLIEAALRLSTEIPENAVMTDGTKPKFQKDEDETKDDPPPARNWNGPKGRATVNAVTGGGGHARLQITG